MPRLFAPWMPCPTRPCAGCFTVCELTFFGLSSGVGKGRRSMCRPLPVGLASQIRGGGIPRGFRAPVPTSAAWLLGLPRPAAGLCQRCGGWARAHPSRLGPRPHPKGSTATRKETAGAARGAKTQQRPNGHKCTRQHSQGASKPPKAPHPCRSQGGPPSPKPGGGRAEDKRQGLPRGTCFGPITTTAPRRALQGSARGPLGPALGGPRPLRPLLKFEGAASQRPPAHRRERGPGGQATRPIYWADCRWGARIPQPLCARPLPGTKKPRDKWGGGCCGRRSMCRPQQLAPPRSAAQPPGKATPFRQSVATYQGSSHIR